MPAKWLILLGPISVTIAQFFVSPIIQFFITELIFSKKLTDKEIKLGNIYVAVYSFFLSWIILLVVSLIYARFMPGIAGLVSWGLVIVCVLLILAVFIGAKKLVIPDAFGEDRGIEIGIFRAQLENPWNKLRIVVAIMSWIPAVLVFLGCT